MRSARQSQRLLQTWWACVIPIVGVLLSASIMRAEETSEPKPLPTMEESVLVAERQGLGDPKEDAQSLLTDQLEPIAQVTDYAPDLAESIVITENPNADRAEETTSSSDDDEAGPRGLTAVANSLQSVSTRFLVNPSTEPSFQTAEAFHGIQPGVSTAEDVMSRWGEPLRHRRTEEGLILSFRVEPYRVVDVLVEDDVVEAMKVDLKKASDPLQVEKKFHLEDVDPVDIVEENGEAIGIAFPERGVVFMLQRDEEAESETEQPLVSYVIIERLDPEAFVLRAEQHLHGPYQKNVADLKQAIALDDEYAHAYRLLAEIYLATGKPSLAEEVIARALELNPENDGYRMLHVRCLETQAEYDEAVYETRAVLDKKGVDPLVKAEAFHRLGCLATFGDESIASKAIAFQNDAIALADKIAASKDSGDRRAAKELLVDAHLAIAREIARQEYRNKTKAIAQWLSRASGLAEDCIANDGGSLELRLRVAKQGLASVADLRPPKDPHPWVLEAEETVAALKKEWDDERWQEHLAWEMGQIYYHALCIEHVRRQTPSAIRFGRLAIDNLAEGARSRQAVPPSEQLVGNLYFHVGVVHAVHNEDHAKAIAWYDKAAPLLMAATPESDLVVPRQEGESLVSMGVSYWQEGQAARALDLTHAGTKLIEKSIEGGVTTKDRLSVPYTNLATMYEELGNPDEALKYSRRAKSGGATLTDASRSEISQTEATVPTRAKAKPASSPANLPPVAVARPKSRQTESNSTSTPARRGRISQADRRTSRVASRDDDEQMADSNADRTSREKGNRNFGLNLPSIELAAPNFRSNRPMTRVSATYVR